MASAKAIEAGGAFIRIFAKDADLLRALNRAQVAVGKFAAFMKSTGKQLTRTGLIFAGMAGAIFRGTLSKSRDGTFGEQAKKDAKEFDAAWNQMTTAMQSALLPLVKLLTPILKGLGEFIKQNKGLVLTLAGAAVALVGVGFTMQVLGTALAGAVMLFGALKAAILLLLTPVGLLLAGIGALGFAMLKATSDSNPAFLKFGDMFGNLKEIAGSTFKGITDAMSAGDFELAADIACAGIEAAWSEMLRKLTEQWGMFKDDWVDSFHEAVRQIRHGLDDLQTSFAKTMTSSATMWDVMAHAEDAVGWIEKQLGMNVGENKSRIAAEELRRDPHAITRELDKMNQERKDAADAIARQKMEEGRKARDADNEEARKNAAQKIADLHMKQRLAANKAAMAREQKPQIPNVLADAAKGMFTAPNFQQALGLADKIDQKQLDEAKKQNEHLAKIEHLLEKAGPLVFA